MKKNESTEELAEIVIVDGGQRHRLRISLRGRGEVGNEDEGIRSGRSSIVRKNE